MSIVGVIVSAVLMIKGEKPKRFGMCWYFPVGKGWGCELGTCFLADTDETYSLMCHELGHSLQNLKFGPLTPFLISIPSAYRFWMREQDTYDKMKSFIAWEMVIANVALLFLIAVFDYFALVVPLAICFVLIVYNLILNYFMLNRELPKYENNKWPKYDDIWFEADASKSGTAFMEKYYKDN